MTHFMFVFLFTGACTHGDRCSRIHNKPTFSQTVLLSNLYINPQNSAKTADGSHLANVTDQEMQEHYDNFFEDVFVECEDKYGQVGAVENFSPCAYNYSLQVEEMNVCDNLGDHLVGNVYVKFKKEDVSIGIQEFDFKGYVDMLVYLFKPSEGRTEGVQ